MVRGTPYKSGDKYSFLTLTGKSYNNPKTYVKYVEVICDCGVIKFLNFRSLLIKETFSCGCMKGKLRAEKGITHGFTNNKEIKPLYRCWVAMKSRCYNIKDAMYKNYGGRGIKISDSWLSNFVEFKNWSDKNGWRKGLSLDRINNDGNYEEGNCRWVTFTVQSRNRRTTRMMTAFGETKCLKDWILDSRCKVSGTTLHERLKTGNWTIKDAITTENKIHYATHSLDILKDSKFCRDKDTIPLYGTWVRMRGKCLNSKDRLFYDYGGRGIELCEEWVDNFKPFYDWSLQNGWQKGLTLDRIDNNGNYSPLNCRWTTMHIQNRNKRNTRFLTAFSETKCFADWVTDSRCVVSHSTLHGRIKRGLMSIEDALTLSPNFK